MQLLARRSATLLACVLCHASHAFTQDAGQPLNRFVHYEGEEEGTLEFLGWGDAFSIVNYGFHWSIYILWMSDEMVEIAEVIEVPPLGEVIVSPPADSWGATANDPLPKKQRLTGSEEINAICIYDCLTAGTLVQTPSGPCPVEELKAEHLAPPSLQAAFPAPVQITKRWTRQTTELTLNGERLTLTGGHRIATADGGWTRADQIQVGAEVLAGGNGDRVRVTGVEQKSHGSPLPVYSVRFQEAGSIYVGQTGIQVEAPAIEAAPRRHSAIQNLDRPKPSQARVRVEIQSRLRAQRSRRLGTPFWSSLACRP